MQTGRAGWSRAQGGLPLDSDCWQQGRGFWSPGLAVPDPVARPLGPDSELVAQAALARGPGGNSLRPLVWSPAPGFLHLVPEGWLQGPWVLLQRVARALGREVGRAPVVLAPCLGRGWPGREPGSALLQRGQGGAQRGRLEKDRDASALDLALRPTPAPRRGRRAPRARTCSSRALLNRSCCRGDVRPALRVCEARRSCCPGRGASARLVRASVAVPFQDRCPCEKGRAPCTGPDCRHTFRWSRAWRSLLCELVLHGDSLACRSWQQHRQIPDDC